MMVTVQRTGGFAGLTRTWQVDVDAEPDAESWLVLIDELPWGQADDAPSTQRDRFIWLISAGTRPAKEATLPEQQVTGPWRELVDRVRRTSEAEAGDGSPRDDPHGRA